MSFATSHTLEPIRDLLRSSLAASLRDLTPEDRLSAAWTVACGRVMAEHSAVTAWDGSQLTVEVADSVWLGQMSELRASLARETARIAALPVSAIHFILKQR